MTIAAVPYPIEYPTDTYPQVGEKYRLIYRISGADPTKATWPEAIARLANDNPYLATGGHVYVAERKTVVVDVQILIVPTLQDFADMESMLGSIRHLNLSANNAADIVGIEALQFNQFVCRTCMQSSAYNETRTVWGSIAPELVDDSYTLWDRLADTAQQTTQTVVGGSANIVASGINTILQPKVFALVFGIVLIYAVATRKG